jgi:signal transduction histidine kinase
VSEGSAGADAVRDADEAARAADLPYLVENVPKAFDRALDGLERVATIVRSMKEFAHPDSREMAPVDLNRAVAATLSVANNEYKYVAELETDYGEIPPVTCHVGDVNQVVLNILVNAAHAIGDVVGGTDRKGRIHVRTRQEGDAVVVSISDTGPGIPEAVREHIFDPFFTTKEVGKGTGQGLAIARSVVVEKHGGHLEFDTEAGKGTTFHIRLPIAGKSGAVGVAA